MFPYQPQLPSQPEPAPEASEDDEVVLTDVEEIMRDPVLRWRAKRLADNGMTPFQARALALDRNVDVHYVINHLIGRGCTPDIAFDIASH